MKLKELRIKRELSLKTLSELTNIPYRTLQDIEHGKISINNTSSINLYKISKALGVKMESLIDLENLQATM